MSREWVAITLWQPWATAIALGLKHYETRSWSTAYRGPIMIHAARRWTRQEQDFHAKAIREVEGMLGTAGALIDDLRATPPFGAVIAVADLVNCECTYSIAMPDSLDQLFGDFSPGRFAWQLENVIKLKEPIPTSGLQGLWTPSGDLVDAVENQL
jgi:hypothetical protein